MYAVNFSHASIRRAKRRHPEWFPARPDEQISWTVYLEAGLSPARVKEQSGVLALSVPQIVEAHDARRRGRSPDTTYFECTFTGEFDGETGVTATYAIAAETASELRTHLTISQLGGPRRREDSPAWRAYSGGRPSASAAIITCANPACPLVAARAPARLMLCGRCSGARYCGAACQRAHWPEHKLSCM